ncbi:UNVERIFIED_CONTAM: Arogenate dehydratase 3, chloroplastic [Sesamum angustifolium]|uniref:Arogenate dehydratase 3, chloroplastic n=1 Tax=Sesamum angustifolium TaxID=2727405 RepID=A0AAW2QPR3_9LAMI
MQSLSPLVDLKSLFRTAPPPPGLGLTHHRVGPGRYLIQCVSRFDAANVNANSSPSAAQTSGSNLCSGHVGRARHEWQSACAILASKVVSQQQDTEKSGGADGVSAVNGHPTLDLVPVKGQSNSPTPLPKPLSIADLSPAPMHGSHLRVAYQGVPGAYSEAAAGKLTPTAKQSLATNSKSHSKPLSSGSPTEPCSRWRTPWEALSTATTTSSSATAST